MLISWNKWLNALDKLLDDEIDRKIPDSGLWLESHKQFYLAIKNHHNAIETAYQSVRLKQVCYSIETFVKKAQEQIYEDIKLKKSKLFRDYWRTSLALQGMALRSFTQWLVPILPECADKLA